MSDKRREDELLDRAIDEMKSVKVDDQEIANSADRVWKKLDDQTAPGASSSQIRNCEDFQNLIPAYLEGSLSTGRSLFLQEHVKECISCRKALTAARTQKVAPPVVQARRIIGSQWMKWGSLAASILMVAVVVRLGIFDSWFPWSSRLATLESVEGQIFQVESDHLSPLLKQASIEEHQVLRTAKSSGAVLRLYDGSLIEVDERTEFALADSWSGTTVQLKRGNVIVEAADQGSGRLFVSTGDFRVAVKGTIFSVSHGVKGSRVSVIEGEVWVEGSKEDTVLTAGERFASQPQLVKASIEDDYSWSQNADVHLALLGELRQLHKEIKAATFSDQLRYQSDLAGLLPAGTLVYGAFPNLSNRIDEIYQMFMQRVQEDPTLREWYLSNVNAEEAVRLEELVGTLKFLGAQLGPEIVFSLVNSSQDFEPAPLVLAETPNPELLHSLVEEQIVQIRSESQEEVNILLVRDVTALPSNADGELVVLIDNGLLLVSPSATLVRQVATGQGSSIAESDFFDTLSASYQDGVDWLFAIDMDHMMSMRPEEATDTLTEQHSTAFEKLGVSQLGDLVVERKRVADVTENRAVLTYNQVEGGMMSWIAEPGPMGALDFVSQDAHMVAAFVISEPRQLVSDVLDFVARTDPEGFQEVLDFESIHGVSFLDGLAAPLGGEVVFAFDGPVLPTPGWKVIVEVYDPVTLQSTLEKLVAELNSMAVEEGESGFTLVPASGSLYALQHGTDPVLYYGYLDGYLIIAPDPTLIGQTAQYRAVSYTLANSPGFRELLARDGSMNMSGLFYQNLAPLLGPLADSPLGEVLGNLSPEGRDTVASLLGDTPPMLVSLSSEPGKLILSSSGGLEDLWFNIGTLSTLGGPEGIAAALTNSSTQ